MDKEYEDEIKRNKLKTEDLGEKEVFPEGRYTPTSHGLTMETSIKGAKWEKTTNHIHQVRKVIPSILQEKLRTGHADWEVFLKQ